MLLALAGALLPLVTFAQGAPTRTVVPPVPRPFAIVRVQGAVVRAPDAKRAAHIPTGYREQFTWSLRVDSAAGGVLHSSAALYEPLGANAVAAVRIPVERGVLGLPSVSTRPRPTRAMSNGGRYGAELPRAQAEQVAVHAYLRTLIESGALFEAGPSMGAGVRRTHFADGTGDVALTIDAVRSSRVMRDTSVSGRRARVVRDSTAITIVHALLRPSRFHKTVERVRESVRGTIVGIRLVDAETHRAFLMRDTLTMKGTIVLDDGLGGAFRSPLFISSARTSTLHDAFWQSATPREPFDIVRYDAVRPQPLTRAGRDSLFSRLESARTLGARDSIRGALLARTSDDATPDTTTWSRVRARALAIGDTASILARLTEGIQYRDLSISVADYHMLRPSLADAATAFRNGVDRELLALNLLDALMRKPPVLAPDGEPPVCRPDACAAMRADVQTGQPGLQAVGLVAAMVSDPRVWTDSVIAYAATNPFLATRALWFAQGVASSAVAGAKAPMPEPNAPYDAWRHWLVGRDSSYERSLRADTAMLRISRSINRRGSLHVSPEAVSAIRFAAVRTGHDYAAAFRRYRDSTTSDSARALFNTLLIAIGDRVFTDAEMARILANPQGADRLAAKAQLSGPGLGGMGAAGLGRMPPASDSIAAIIGRHIVNMVFADSVLARSDSPAGGDRWYRVPAREDSLPRYVLMHEYPDAVRARATELGFAPVERGWTLRPGDSAYLIEFGPVLQRGPFVQVAVTHSTLFSRGTTRSGGYASGFTLTLVEGPAGWVVVDATAWVT
ncbi:hypothetical protein [Gemmatimonas groenlandica]|uniref:Uncharacterized protein n=1 Tax=Gemmatimonas groenlandica TaxID=2732249 RepID=A0A6M4IJJ3_9BACT|nr:hypothetical protein [Gemmatimonas groenlandica]QJR34008.1 hypothetical protein HKW67_21835 [Gemmatimonas groenlandica]